MTCDRCGRTIAGPGPLGSECAKVALTDEGRTCGGGCGSTNGLTYYRGGWMCPTCLADYKLWRSEKGRPV